MAEQRIWELVARKLAGEASAAELEELDQQLRTRPDLHLSVQAVTDLWAQQVRQPDQQEVQSSYQQHLQRMERMGITIEHPAPDNPSLITGKRTKYRGKMVWLAAATTIGIAFAAWFFYQSYTAQPTTNSPAGTPLSEITTKNGSKTRVQLPDGTQVWLNAGSRLTYEKNFGNVRREVTLTGEGYFDVVRNEQKPFIIHTTKMDVKVLGTSFNVRSYPNEKTTEAALIHGSIEVALKDRPAEKIILRPNEKIVVFTGKVVNTIDSGKIGEHNPQDLVSIKKLTYQQNDSAVVETSWKDNKLIFIDESFRDLAVKMERWYNISIQFADERSAALRFTGIFQDETVEEAMRALNITAHFKYSIHGKNITITR